MLIEGHAPATGRSSYRKFWIAGGATLAVAATVLAVMAHWPFTREGITAALEGSSAQTVEMETFRRLYFPPGCVAERVRFRNHGKVVMTVEKLAIKGSLTGLLGNPKRIAEVRVTGLKVEIPSGKNRNAPGPEIPLNAGPQADSVAISRIVADGAVLEFLADQPGEKPYRLEIRKLELTDIGAGTPMPYRAVLINTVPPGEIHSEGRFGPWNPKDPGSTPLTGNYTYEHVNLGVFGGVSGTLDAKGTFRGILGKIETKGTTDAPAFHVEGGHPVHLTTSFQATVNGLNGDTLLQSVIAGFRRTKLEVSGPIAGKPDHEGKTANLNVAIRGGRVDDLLQMFGSDPRAPMSGALNLRAKVVWPPGKAKFLQKIGMDIDFAITGGTFASTNTQGTLDRLSASGRGISEKDGAPPTAIAELKGHAAVRNGVANFSPLTFDIPEANAAMHGSYRLLPKEIDLSGTLQTTGKLSKATSGMKSLLIKVITPLYKKRNSVTVVPFKIKGPSRDATVSLDWKKRP